MTSPLDELLESIRGLSPEEAFRLYLDRTHSPEGGTAHVALGLRDKARAGELDGFEGAIPMLEAFLADAPDAETALHLAKALAAFGRAAQSAVPALLEQLAEMRVVDDVTYWAFDGCVWALGYLGGDMARACLDEIAAESPSRAAASRSVYEGALGDEERETKLRAAILGALALCDDPGDPRWRQAMLPKKGMLGRPDKKKSWTLR
jgi:hypothetical protein